ncbi:hypothetical protein Cpap_1412 [Ruminiclostridium papyrosolvens DSM 2782]|uniref:DUF2304 domain-containing protein n=1 Tax=Ruminiclostridium papyrosolvens DSM 2782 TaxID=588581 RepID=F1TFE8_9FIRM|nr:DUF2304 domain-containing protein [Ruminiclostridium papyrosolvens]EGD46872.1 hypothetical protein Cpap_1412 [Ruminiclostridium papyrosolvens DSM 2782]WES34357.1 DUF2304 domain-containing protein [Ruminiclostridium papyrosolvens DSM 2782]
MNIRLQISILLIGFILLTSILKMVQKTKLDLKYSILWIVSSVMFIIIAAFPVIPHWVADLIGIIEPANAVFLVLILFELGINLNLTITISKQTNKVKNMAQYIALMENQNREKS